MPILTRLVDRARALGLTRSAIQALRALLAETEAVQKAGRGSGRRRGTPRGSKAKGRLGVIEARTWLLRWFPGLVVDDIYIQTTSVGGSDIRFSPHGAAAFPFEPEVKNVEAFNVWAACKQAELNAKRRGRFPCLFFKRNNTEMWVAFPCAQIHHLTRLAGPDEWARRSDQEPAAEPRERVRAEDDHPKPVDRVSGG